MAEGLFVKRALRMWAVGLVFAGLLPAAASAGEVAFSPQNNPPNASDGWQAGTCNTPTCAPDSPKAEFFETSAGHPPFGITQFIVRHSKVLLHEEPQVNMKTLRVDLPVGLSVNPGAVPQCPATVVHPGECPAETKVGESQVTVSAEDPLTPPVPITASVYNLVPKPGQPARFGFTVEAVPLLPVLPPSDIFLEADVAWESDFHEGFTIQVPKVTGVKLLKNRLIFNGRASTAGGGFKGFFLTTPSTCFDPTQPATSHTYSTYARADSLENPDPQFPKGSPFVESALPPGTSPKGCGTIPFRPTLGVDPGPVPTDSPSGAAVEVKLPIESSETGQETSTVRTARVTLPAGMGLNPSAAQGLVACTDEQFKKGIRVDNNICPPNSKIGTVSVATPPLPEEPLTGNVYVGVQKSRVPQSGEQFRILVEAKSLRYGVVVRLVGNVIANPQTGQLTTTFDDPPKLDSLRGELPHGLPQVPFTSFRLDFDDGPKAVLTSPPICGPLDTTGELTPWSALFTGRPPAAPSTKFTLASAPGGGPCAKTMAARPFAPSFSAQPNSTKAATFTPFQVRIGRGDGQQELKGVDITLPPGATAKLAGTPYCPPTDIAAAAASAGAAERANASCPAKSQIGVATVTAGSGTSPLTIGGKAYLAGRFQGAPVSLVVVTPAVAGPFDLGTVMVRVPLFVDPETAQIRAATNEIPDVFGGAKLDVRSIAVNVNKDEFALTGTNCAKFATAGALKGGGADPANPAAFSSFPVSNPVQLHDCPALKFRPKLNLRLFGATRRAKHPRLRAVLKARAGDANIGRAVVALPHALFLDQASLGKICTRVQFAANDCPKKSRYGTARAFTPLLGQPLEGPVYLRSSNNPLPDLVAHLGGQVDIDLVGRIDSFKGGIRTTFGRVPDVPVSKFVMTLPGGKRGLLVASRNLCKGKVKAIIRFKAQNGKKVGRRSTLRTPCGKKSKGKKSGQRN